MSPWPSSHVQVGVNTQTAVTTRLPRSPPGHLRRLPTEGHPTEVDVGQGGQETDAPRHGEGRRGEKIHQNKTERNRKSAAWTVLWDIQIEAIIRNRNALPTGWMLMLWNEFDFLS